MSPILLWMLIGIVGVGLVGVGTYFYSSKWIEILYFRDKDDLDFILDTRDVPPRWSMRYAKKTERMRKKGASESSIEKVKIRADRYYLRRLRRIKAFARSDSFYQYNKTAKMVVQSDLERIHGEWVRKEYPHEPY